MQIAPATATALNEAVWCLHLPFSSSLYVLLTHEYLSTCLFSCWVYNNKIYLEEGIGPTPARVQLATGWGEFQFRVGVCYVASVLLLLFYTKGGLTLSLSLAIFKSVWKWLAGCHAVMFHCDLSAWYRIGQAHKPILSFCLSFCVSLLLLCVSRPQRVSSRLSRRKEEKVQHCLHTLFQWTMTRLFIGYSSSFHDMVIENETNVGRVQWFIDFN